MVSDGDAGPLVLVVDDNLATQYSTTRILRGAGFRVVAAASAAEALELAERHVPDLIILDINLPDLDGFEVCRRLRASSPLSRTPIVYLSATFVDDIDKAHGLDAGADGYLTHPVESPVLIGTVSALLRARRAEEAVQISEARFKALFEQAMNGIAILSDDLVFVDANPALCRMLGRDPASIGGRHLSAFNVKDQQTDLAAIATALRLQGQWQGTMAVLDARGSHVELEWNITSHQVQHLSLAIVSDITARIALEAERERLHESERLARIQAEEANRSKDQFLAALSHELRTPLNAIVGFARLLQRSSVVTADPRVLGHVDAIERNAWVQARLISDLLDISRITSGKLELDRQRMSAAEAVEAALSSIQGPARAKKITLDVQLDRSPASIWWDPSRFQQVVWNLVDNAVKFSPVGGVVKVVLRETPTRVDLIVADFGQGISEDFLPHVFDRFRQEDSTSKRGHGGLGLGLAIVQQLVTAHGGTITARSPGEGLGATFLVELPRIAESEDTPAVPSSQVPGDVDLSGCRILVVDDNDDARALLQQLLASASARVMPVPSVDAALAALPTFLPHLLISDLAMPYQDGYDLIRRVRAMGFTPHKLPAIALSAFARVEDRGSALQAGYQAHIAKPWEPESVLAQVDALLHPGDAGRSGND